MATVRELLKFKGDTKLVTIAPDKTVLEAIQLMADKEIGSLIVLDGVSIVGVVTERDYARKIVLEGRSSSNTPVKDIMRSKVRCIGPGANIDDCRAVMTEDSIRYVPVVDNGFLIGLISIGDVVRHAISEQDFLIEQLTLYVSGSHPVKMRN